MRKLRILVGLLVFTCTASFAQTTQDSLSKWWFGFNGASFVNDSYDALPMLSLNYNFKSNNNFRLQVGRKTSSFDLDGDSGPGTDSVLFGQNIDTTLNTRRSSSNTVVAQFGYYRTSKVGQKAQIYWGIDAILRRTVLEGERNVKTEITFSANQKQFNTLESKSKTTILRYGVGPLVGYQFNATRRLAVGFEIQSQLLVHDTEKEHSRSTLQTFSFSPQITETNNQGVDKSSINTHTLATVAGLFLYYRL
ncbi:MAG: hypothetical protein JJ975_10475 [Bacteroidia bacterium]|nr:hypothetical protein [Bacteroidia bacterium]